jgi:hypothetical protein
VPSRRSTICGCCARTPPIERVERRHESRRRETLFAPRVARRRPSRPSRPSSVARRIDGRRSRRRPNHTQKNNFLPPRATPHPRPARVSPHRDRERRVNASASRDDRAVPVAVIVLARDASTSARLDVRAWRLKKILTINRPSGMRTMGVDIASSAEGRCDDRWIRGRGDVVSI